jgi:hypothetical protein
LFYRKVSSQDVFELLEGGYQQEELDSHDIVTPGSDAEMEADYLEGDDYEMECKGEKTSQITVEL